MGLYDTFVFEKPFPCPDCGTDIRSVQSKAFGCLIDMYRVGDAISDCGIRIGVVEEDLYCDSHAGFVSRSLLRDEAARAEAEALFG